MSLRFDTAYYLEQNPDVAAAVTAGAIPGAKWHYETYGAAEGRNPNAVFDTSEYLEANPDVADAVAAGIVGPFAHFLAHGAAEGRAPSAAYQDVATGFDGSAYLAANPDVAEAVASGSLASGYEHWIKFGQYEASREAVYSDGSTAMPAPAPGDDGVETVDVVAGELPVATVVASVAAGAEVEPGATFADMTIDGDAVVPTTLPEIETSFELGLGDGADTSGLTLLDPARLNIEDGATVTMTSAQYRAFTDINAGVANTPGHETVVFSDAGRIDLSDESHLQHGAYNYVEEFRLSDEGNTFIAPDNGFLITGGAGDDRIITSVGDQWVTPGEGDDWVDFSAGETDIDILTYALGEDGDDTLVGFVAAGADGNAADVGPGEDALRFSGVEDVAALALRVDAVRFDDNGPRASASKDGGIDMALDFQNGGSLTFVDFLEAATLVEETPLTSAVPSGESVALTGVNADDLSMLFGASLTFEA